MTAASAAIILIDLAQNSPLHVHVLLFVGEHDICLVSSVYFAIKIFSPLFKVCVSRYSLL